MPIWADSSGSNGTQNREERIVSEESWQKLDSLGAVEANAFLPPLNPPAGMGGFSLVVKTLLPRCVSHET